MRFCRQTLIHSLTHLFTGGKREQNCLPGWLEREKERDGVASRGKNGARESLGCVIEDKEEGEIKSNISSCDTKPSNIKFFIWILHPVGLLLIFVPAAYRMYVHAHTRGETIDFLVHLFFLEKK